MPRWRKARKSRTCWDGGERLNLWFLVLGANALFLGFATAIRYFFVTDRINRGDVSVEWCPTEFMHGDFWTKPTQGKQFTRERDQIMGVTQFRKPEAGKAENKIRKKKKGHNS